MLPIWSSCRFLLSACLLYGEHITAAALRKRALAAKIPLKMEKQRFKSCLNLCQPRFHLWSYQRILRIKNCRTPWDDWLFCHFIYSVRQSWWRLADSNRRPPACEASALTSGARRTGRKPCTARLSFAFSTACSLLLSNPERLRPLLLSYRLIMLLSILLDNTEQLQLFSITFHHPTATWKNIQHLCIILKQVLKSSSTLPLYGRVLLLQ